MGTAFRGASRRSVAAWCLPCREQQLGLDGGAIKSAAIALDEGDQDTVAQSLDSMLH